MNGLDVAPLPILITCIFLYPDGESSEVRENINHCVESPTLKSLIFPLIGLVLSSKLSKTEVQSVPSEDKRSALITVPAACGDALFILKNPSPGSESAVMDENVYGIVIGPPYDPVIPWNPCNP